MWMHIRRFPPPGLPTLLTYYLFLELIGQTARHSHPFIISLPVITTYHPRSPRATVTSGRIRPSEERDWDR
ncbi:hypothetical protein SODALDRAFT_211032 [Sodiomyces alkalinus F11]|uniref:Uncharacterized protein n=1 Tax=Sodiomyces alkalinus (strain CBS 110278 / VKM F-3762 / F11) TaxID=1314773 RepID=A0A3N2PQZ3_SODAK|nr:hypothetical protein SODALDRAFT_211032 [Sodiomyces alkalinus F11]ROT36933.1 hypothetical protein SODALDRAFT_211032 [Sodiomyces alkalinus F11]